MDRELQMLVLGALLHDISKFTRRIEFLIREER